MNIAISERRICLMAAMLVTVLAACGAAPKVRVDRDGQTNFQNYRTYAWLQQKPGDSAGPNAAVDAPDERAHASVATALQAKGYVFDDAHPDVRVGYALNVYERPRQSGLRIGVGAGGVSGNVAGGVGASFPVGKRNETVAAMTVDIFDVARNVPVWHGASEMVLSGAIATDTDVQNLTDSILAKYPRPSTRN